MSIFLYNDYRIYLKDFLSKLPLKGHGELSKISKAIGVHQTLMSLVLSGQRDLSLEQGYALAIYLELTDIETEYFSLLIQWSRAGNKHYQEFLERKIRKISEEANQISKRVEKNKDLTDQQRAVIYSSWIYSAVRLFTSVGDKGQTIDAIQAKFRLSRPKAIEVLTFLESAGLISKDKDRYKMAMLKTFLEQGSPHLTKHHFNWRLKAMNRAGDLSDNELQFTSPVSLSKKDFARLREQMAEFIKQFLKTVSESPAEDIACFNMDFFWIEK